MDTPFAIVTWCVCVFGCALAITGIGIFAWRRKAPMWFWSGKAVQPWEILDIPSYNRANGKMWILYSLHIWVAGVAGIFSPLAGGIIIGVGSTVGIVVLILVYQKIYRKYAR